MKLRKAIRKDFVERLRNSGEMLIIYNDWQLPTQVSYEVRGLKNYDKNDRNIALFKFKNKIDIKNGSVLNPKGSFDLWRVFDSADGVILDT